MPTTPSTAQTLDRGLQILEILGDAEQDLTTTEIAVALDVHRTIAHRLVATLEQRGFVSRSPTNRYQLGTTLIRLSSRVGGHLRMIARPALATLNKETDETVHLAIAAGADVLFLDSFESAKALRVTSRIGQTLPAYATSVGKAMLARLPEKELHMLFPNKTLGKIAENTIATRAELFKHLDIVRMHGYAISAEESESGVGSIGVAIVDRRGATRAALGIGAPVSRMTPAIIPRLALAVQKAAKAIGDML
jgi:DNA-binding IclR family transcriptional regulator